MATDQISVVIAQITARGYVYSKDAMGVYFDNGQYRLSVIYHGPGFLAFINRMTPFGWQLVRKSDFSLSYINTLNWLVEQLNNI